MIKENLVPQEWRITSFGVLAKPIRYAIVDGPFGSQMKVHEFVNSGIPLIEMYHIKEDRFDPSFRRYISKKKLPDVERSLVCAGDVIISKTGSLGYVALMPENIEKGIITSRLAKMTIDWNYVDKLYLFHYLIFLRQKGYWEKVAKGTTMKILNIRQLVDAEIPFPSLIEQQKIAEVIEECLSDLDNAIENLQKAREQLKIYRQVILRNAFVGQLTNGWRCKNKALYHDRHLFPEVVIEQGKDLPGIPKEWIYTLLSRTGDLSRGKSKHRPRNDPKLFSGKYPFIQTGEIRAAKNIVKTYTETYNEFGLAQSKLWPIGTLCITIAANIAETAFLGIEACFPDSVVGFCAFDSVADPRYIDYFIQSAKQRIQAYAPATAQKNINLAILENLIIPYCHPKEQCQIVQEIESRFSVCDKAEESINENLSKASTLRHSILKQAFDGRLTEQWRKNHKDLISGDNSAEALLEKIKAGKEALRIKPKGKKKYD